MPRIAATTSHRRHDGDSPRYGVVSRHGRGLPMSTPSRAVTAPSAPPLCDCELPHRLPASVQKLELAQHLKLHVPVAVVAQPAVVTGGYYESGEGARYRTRESKEV